MARKKRGGTFMKSRGGFESYLKDIQKDMMQSDKEAREDAAKYLVDKIKIKVGSTGRSRPGQPPRKKSGNLQKGIKFRNYKSGVTLVGAGRPAHHAHLVELGTVVASAHPFFKVTFQEEAQNIKDIISGKFKEINNV